jgi:EF hand
VRLASRKAAINRPQAALTAVPVALKAGAVLPHRSLAALDLNHDGVISADEIAKAPESLKKLDKNGDGQLTPDELRPPRPPGGPRRNEAPQPRD